MICKDTGDKLYIIYMYTCVLGNIQISTNFFDNLSIASKFLSCYSESKWQVKTVHTF